MSTTDDRIIRLPEVIYLTGRSRSAIYRLVAESSDFPQPVRLGRSVGWRMSEIQEWIASRERVA